MDHPDTDSPFGRAPLPTRQLRAARVGSDVLFPAVDRAGGCAGFRGGERIRCREDPGRTARGKDARPGRGSRENYRLFSIFFGEYQRRRHRWGWHSPVVLDGHQGFGQRRNVF